MATLPRPRLPPGNRCKRIDREVDMQPISALDSSQLAGIRGVFTDIDDTLSTDGRLTASAYGAMERLYEAGLRVIPITGRPAGWCDHIARMWPVTAVVGENGALYFLRDKARGGLFKRYACDQAERAENRRRLRVIRDRILSQVPGAGIASDQDYRVADLAIDFCEDVSPLPEESIDRIVSIARTFGATAKVSSIHVNIWFGSFDKLSMARNLCREQFAEGDEEMRENYVFVGDSPNDEPMFGFFPLGVGVANVLEFRNRMTQLPRYVSGARCGAGFAELADMIIACRGDHSSAAIRTS
jgi:HAD superfamily hydrolase (TIGR01484 family)